MEPSVTGMNSAERYSEPTPGVPHFGGTPPKLKTHPPLVAMLMGLPVKVFSVIVVMSPELPAHAMAVRFRPALMAMGMLMPVLVTMGLLLARAVMVGVLMVVGMFMTMGMHIAVLMVFLLCCTSFKRQFLTKTILSGLPLQSRVRK
jgi:hypothetical protein